MSIEEIDAKVAELKAPGTFDVRAALSGQTYPTQKVKVFVNAAVAHEMNVLAEDAARLRWEAGNLMKGHEGITEPEGYAEKITEAEDAETKVAELLAEVQASAMTFTLRGLAPAQFRLIDKKWRKNIKPPVRKNFSQDSDGEEEYELEVFERNMARNQSINHDLIASSIIKVENAAGQADTSVWKHDDVQNLFDTLLETEYEKLRLGQQDLTFAHTLFNKAIEEDADFLSKP
jgi:hypothetical protein